jgi:hypothetical protein
MRFASSSDASNETTELVNNIFRELVPQFTQSKVRKLNSVTPSLDKPSKKKKKKRRA